MCEALFFNALTMWKEGNGRQFIHGSDYDGIIESGLEAIEYLGEEAIPFEAMVSSQDWEGTQVKFVVHVDALKKATDDAMWESMKVVMHSEDAPEPPPVHRSRSQYNTPFSMN